MSKDYLFQKGNNLGGRRAANKGGKLGSLQLANKMLTDALPDVLKSVIQSAKDGDMAACKMILDKKLANLKSIEVTGIDRSKLPRMIISANTNVIEVEAIDVEDISDKESKAKGNKDK